MKIVEVNTYTVRPRWGFVEIVTDEGLTGWGEPVLEGHCATVLACVQEMKPYLIGKDPMRIEDFSAVLYRAGFYRGGGVLMSRSESTRLNSSHTDISRMPSSA